MEEDIYLVGYLDHERRVAGQYFTVRVFRPIYPISGGSYMSVTVMANGGVTPNTMVATPCTFPYLVGPLVWGRSVSGCVALEGAAGNSLLDSWANDTSGGKLPWADRPSRKLPGRKRRSRIGPAVTSLTRGPSRQIQQNPAAPQRRRGGICRRCRRHHH